MHNFEFIMFIFAFLYSLKQNRKFLECTDELEWAKLLIKRFCVNQKMIDPVSEFKLNGIIDTTY